MGWKLTKEAEAAQAELEASGETVHSFGGGDGFWYDITDGGYFNPGKALADEGQIAEVQKAVALLKSLEDEVYSKIVPEF